jgi:hypothetical protein
MASPEKRYVPERRKHPRFNVDLPVKYSRAHWLFKSAHAVNASEGGLLVDIPEKMEINQALTLQLFFPSRPELYTLEALVRVVWNGIHLREDWTWDYRTGVRFVGISPEDISEFKNFLMGSAQEPSCPS